MYTCTFFGHSDCPDNIESALRECIVDLIKNKEVGLFLVGNEGKFDKLVQRILWELKQQDYKFDYYVVTAYFQMLKKDDVASSVYKHPTMMPADFEKVPPRYAIDFRNNYMLKEADFVVVYVTRSFGGAAKFVQKAVRKKKMFINIADIVQTVL